MKRNRAARWILFGVIAFLLVSMLLIWLYYTLEQKRVQQYNKQLRDLHLSVQLEEGPTGNLTTSTLRTRSLIAKRPADDLTRLSEQESQLVDYQVNIRSLISNRSLAIDWALDMPQLQDLKAPAYSSTCPRTSTHVGFHRWATSTVGFRERLFDWSLFRLNTSTPARYMIVSAYFPTVCVSANAPSTVVLDDVLVNRFVNRTTNLFEFVQAETNIFYIRQPNSALYLREVDAPLPSWVWSTLGNATPFVVMGSFSALNRNYYFPRLPLAQATQLYAISVKDADNWADNLHGVGLEMVGTNNYGSLYNNLRSGMALVDDNTNIFYLFERGTFEFEDVKNEKDKVLVEGGWYTQFYRVQMPDLTGANGRVLGAVFGDQSYPKYRNSVFYACYMSGAMSGTVRGEDDIDFPVSFDMVLDRAFVSKPDYGLKANPLPAEVFDNTNPYSVSRLAVPAFTDTALRDEIDFTELAQLFDNPSYATNAAFVKNQGAFQDTFSDRFSWSSGQKNFLFRMCPRTILQYGSKTIDDYLPVYFGVSYPFATSSLLQWGRTTTYASNKYIGADISAATDNVYVFALTSM